MMITVGILSDKNWILNQDENRLLQLFLVRYVPLYQLAKAWREG